MLAEDTLIIEVGIDHTTRTTTTAAKIILFELISLRIPFAQLKFRS